MTAAARPPSVFDELCARGLVQDAIAPAELGTLLASEQVSFYAGYDPTGESLHAGSLVPITVMARLQRAGHKPYVLIGGATGMIGDPSGKSQERRLLDLPTLEENVAAIRAQLGRFLDFEGGGPGAVMVNNHDWFGSIRYLDFLRDVGKHVTVNYMMAKESVRARLEDRDQGISYTEFSYMLLQAYDFVVLAREHGCKLQVGGSDQWGNITAGVELYRKLCGGSLYGFTAPLLMSQQGEKMGKTAAGTKLWLDPSKTSPYVFYQHWLNVDDADVERMLRFFSWRRLDEIEALCAEHHEAPQQRVGQRALAEDLTSFVHGSEAARGAIAASRVMFGGALDDVRDADLEPLLADVPHSVLGKSELERGIELLEVLTRTELCSSKGAARRLVKGGGVYVNNRRVDDAQKVLSADDLGTETMIILRAGKKSYHVLRVG